MTPEIFFTEFLPERLAARGVQGVGAFSRVPIVVSFCVFGDREGAGAWHLRLEPDAIEVGTGIGDLPLLAVHTPIEDWTLTRPRLASWVERLIDLLSEARRTPWDEVKINRVRNISATIELVEAEHPGQDGPRDLSALVTVNAATRDRPVDLQVIVLSSDYEAMLRGDLRPVRAFGQGAFKFEGDIGLGLRLLLAAR